MTIYVAAIDATAATNGGGGGHQGGEEEEQQRAAQVTTQVQRSAAIQYPSPFVADFASADI